MMQSLLNTTTLRIDDSYIRDINQGSSTLRLDIRSRLLHDIKSVPAWRVTATKSKHSMTARRIGCWFWCQNSQKCMENALFVHVMCILVG